MLIEILSVKSYSKLSEFEVKRPVFGTLNIFLITYHYRSISTYYYLFRVFQQ